MFLLIAEVMERLLHGLAKPLPKASRIKREKFSVQSSNIEPHFFLIAVWDTQEAWHLVAQKSSPEECNDDQNDDADQKTDGLRHETVSHAQISQDRHPREDKKYRQDPHHGK